MAPENELVQICLPTRNGEKHIATSLNSLLHQSHQNILIYVMDNASDDETQKIVKDFCRRDSRIRYRRSEVFVSATENWNRAFKDVDRLRSNYFMWASDDDVWDPRYIRCLLDLLTEDHRATLAFSQFQSLSLEGNVEGEIQYAQPFPQGDAFRQIRLLINDGRCSAIYGLIRLDRIAWSPPLFEASFGSDLWFLMQLSGVGPFIRHNEPLFFKRAGGISATNADASASADPRLVWLLNENERDMIYKLPFSALQKWYLYNRLRVSAKILHPSKRFGLFCAAWALMRRLRQNPQALGVRTKLKQMAGKHG